MEAIYHKGELFVQEKAGESHIGERNGRIIIKKIIPGAVNFIENQPFFIASSKSGSGEISVSSLSGEDGFVKVKNEETLEIFPALLNSNPSDVFWRNIKEVEKIGLVFIEPATRRRFRINGRLKIEEDCIVVSIDQAYPNCPKYIQKREIRKLDSLVYYGESLSDSKLTSGIVNIIQKADTLFVGSNSSNGDMDVSHRGGTPGFVHIEDENTLIIPDYLGNSMYNTLGNFVVNPQAGILFHDFDNKNSLQLSGTAEVFFNGTDEKVNSGGTKRYWIFKINQWVLFENLKGLDWKLLEYSPFNPF